MTKSLRSNDRGAIMLVALAFAIFGVAMLYYAIGVGQTLLLREKMQDAADATALSAAVVHARSMNFIVLLNIIMAALLAILVAFKLVESLALIGIIVAAALAWLTGGSTMALIPPLKGVAAEMKDLYDTTKDPIFTALEVLHDTAGAVASVTPGAAQGLANSDLDAHWKPPVSESLVAMHEEQLPLEDDTFERLCKESGKLAGGLALKPFPFVPGVIADKLKGALGDLTGSMSEWFCGEKGGPPPTPPRQHVNKRYPRTDAMDDCRSEELTPAQATLAMRDPANFSTPKCDESSEDNAAAQPDASTGDCRRDTDCSESGPYEKHAQLAREQCDPTQSPTPYQYSYQTRAGSVAYRYVEKMGWVRGTPQFAAPTFHADQARPPCGPSSVWPAVAVGYEKKVRAAAGGDLQPLCSDETAPFFRPVTLSDPREKTVKFTEVAHVLGCQKSEEEAVPLSNGKAADDSGDPKFPKRVRGDVKLGGETFEMRVFVKSEQAAVGAEKAVKLSLWGAKPPEAALPPGAELRPFAFAQAEYFYDGTETIDAWMWNMNWRARLRLFRLPSEAKDRGELWAKSQLAFSVKDSQVLEVGIHLVEAELAH